MSNILCKYNGMLVIMKVTKCKDFQTRKCPECGAIEFHKQGGWVECDCSFAVDEKAYNKIMNTS